MANGLRPPPSITHTHSATQGLHNSYFDSRQNTIEVYKIYQLQAKKVTQTKARFPQRVPSTMCDVKMQTNKPRAVGCPGTLLATPNPGIGSRVHHALDTRLASWRGTPNKPFPFEVVIIFWGGNIGLVCQFMSCHANRLVFY